MLASLMLSQGVPMLLSGDECRRSQQGNNNAYCQDNTISWFNWRLAEKNETLGRFCRALITFRKAEPTLRQPNFLDGQPVRPGGLPDASWYNAAGEPVDWNGNQSSLAYLLAAAPQDDLLQPPNHHVLMMFHAGGEPVQFTVPPIVRHLPWQQFINTAAESPADVFPDLDGPAPPPDSPIELEGRSLVCYVARDEP
jgi:glycogen operon protein